MTLVQSKALRLLQFTACSAVHVRPERAAQLLRRMSSEREEEVLFEQKKMLGVVVLNRPKALNALNMNMIHTALPMIRRWEEDESVGVILMKGAGDKAFCAGGDVVAVTKAAKAGHPLAWEFFCDEYQLDYAISALKKPFVALIDGITMGGGVGLSVHGWFRVATERTLFAMPETAIGLFPDVGGGYFLPRLQGHLGMFLALTGFRLKGRDVHSAGIATHFVAKDKLPALEDALDNLCNPHLDTVRGILDDFHKQSDNVDPKDFTLADRMDTINECFSKDDVEEIISSLEGIGSEWSKQQLEVLSKMSPTSMKITHHQIREGAKLLLGDCLRMEYRMSQRCMAGHDFHEGVRALLIDRDNTPRWSPDKLHKVTADVVQSYFEPFPQHDMELQLDD